MVWVRMIKSEIEVQRGIFQEQTLSHVKQKKKLLHWPHQVHRSIAGVNNMGIFRFLLG